MISALFLALGTAFAGDELEQLQRGLSSGEARSRRQAVQGLAELDRPDAWKLVIGALDDVNSQVADEAQLQVAKIDDTATLEILLGKEGLGSKDAWVRVRVVEALGRFEAAPPLQALVSALRDKSTDVRRTAAWSVERLQRADELDADPTYLAVLGNGVTTALAKEKDPEARAAQLVAMRLLGSTSDWSDLSTYAADKQPAARSAALLLAREAPPEVALPLARKLAPDPVLGVRLNAADLLAARRSKPAAAALVELFASEKEAVGRWRMLELLRALSGLKIGMNAEAWRGWLRELPDDWSGAPSQAEAPADDEPKTAAFAGLPIRSARVAFLIDLSGSVWELGKQGKTKKQVIDEELTKALQALPPETEFNLIPYTAEPIPWQPGLVRADKKNVDKALDFFVGRKDNGTGNFWDAMLLALEDEKVDTIVVLTDGAPTGGKRWNMGLMKELFAEHNRFRRVVLDAILANAREPLKPHWVEMCASSGGRVVEIDLK